MLPVIVVLTSTEAGAGLPRSRGARCMIQENERLVSDIHTTEARETLIKLSHYCPVNLQGDGLQVIAAQ